jgi:sterol 24-C-methyltransferase/phosphoethanolamine N-methyltransferase
MRLYHKPELLTALYNNLRVRLQKERGPLAYTELLPYDQNHYGGVAALDLCVAACGLGANSRVIQLGSSVGGPSRYLAGRLGCEVLAVELQEDLSGAARELTARCGLQGKVHHVSGNFLQVAKHLAPSSYDCIASWLTILHFDRDERAELFASALRCLKPGGVLFAEDFFERAPFDEPERRTLRHDVYVKYLPSLARYREELVAAGFVVEVSEDLTQEWTAVTRQRVAAFDAERDQQVAVHGEALVDGLRFFYDSVAKLFEGGHCGGVRLLCRKPLDK